MEQKIYAVLTGDIVKSRNLSVDQLKNLQVSLKSATSVFEEAFSGSIVGKLGITRGDGWQVALQKPEYALRLALYLRAVVKSVFKTDTRVSIGIGTVDRLEPENIIESVGPAFIRSGHGLESLSKGRWLAFSAAPEDPRDRLIVQLLDCLVCRWNQRNSFVMAHSLLDKTQMQIAEISPINEKTGKKPERQAIQKMQKALGFGVIEETLYYVEKSNLWRLQ